MKRPYKSKTKSWIYSFVSSLVDLVQGLIGVLTLGLVTPGWDMKLVLWANKRKIKEAINANTGKTLQAALLEKRVDLRKVRDETSRL